MSDDGYQEYASRFDGRRILIGARQSGKTEAVSRAVSHRISTGRNVLLLAQPMEMVQQCLERIAETDEDFRYERVDSMVTNRYPSGRVLGCSEQQIERDRRGWPARLLADYDAVVVDEANKLPEERLFELDAEGPTDILLTATPGQTRTIVEVWADSSPYWETIHVPADDVPFIESERLATFRDSMFDERERREVDAEYERGSY